MIAKIASHLADFTPRLHSNIRALYQFIDIPVIRYPQLKDELFCHNYYLRHLCDLKRFPDWPLRNPVNFDWLLVFFGFLILILYNILSNVNHICLLI